MNARRAFDEELEQLHIELIRMGAMAEEAIEKSITALLRHDRGLAGDIIAGDHQVDNMEKSIEARCLQLLLRQQPVARDLRSVSSALKIITDMERIGDQAADIAEISLHINGDNQLKMAGHLPQMAKTAMEMVHASIDAFVREDQETAQSTIRRDDEVDALFCQVRGDLIAYLQGKANGTEEVDQAIDILMIAKYLERIGDHAVNICEWVEFYLTGEHKHTKIL